MEKIKNIGIYWLKWLEKYTKTDMIYLSRGGFWTIFSQIIVSASTLLLAIAFAYFISKDVYGQYKYVLSIASVLGTFTLTGLGTAVLRSVSDGYEGTLEYAFWKNIRWSVFFFLSTLGVSIYYFVNGNNELGTAMLVVGCFAPLISSTNLYNAYLGAKKDFKRSAIYYNIIGNVFPSLSIFIAIFLTNKPFWLVIVYFVSNTLIGVILYLRVVKIYRPNDKVDKEAISHSKHLSFLGMMGALAENIDQILVFHYIGAAELAIYNFALAIPNQIKGPMKGLAGLIFPKFVERSDREIRSGMKNKVTLIFICSVIIVSVYFLAAPYIYQIFFPKYTDSIFYSQIFSLSLLAMVAIPADAYLVAKKKLREQYIASIIGSIMQIAILYFGIMWAGLIGLVVGQMATKIIWGLMSILLYEKSSKEAILQ